MNKINSDDATHQEEQEQQPSCDNIQLTPLMKFVATKLNKKKNDLVLSGVFQYSILSLLSRSEWVSAKAIQLLEEAGHDNDWLYDTAAIKGGVELKNELIKSLNTGKVSIEKDKALYNQFKKIIDLIVRYFTSDGLDEDDDGNEDNPDDENNAPKAGLGAVLERLAAAQPPPPPPPPPQSQSRRSIIGQCWLTTSNPLI